MSDLNTDGVMSRIMREASEAQDTIRWRHFTEGKIASSIRSIQELHLLSSPTRLSIDSWMKQLVSILGFLSRYTSVTINIYYSTQDKVALVNPMI